MRMLEKTNIQMGYIPLLDCVALLWAHHQGYFAEQGLNVDLIKEPSWASLRDRLAFGFLDTAHCLSAMIPAAVIGEDQLGIALQTSTILSTNRAIISLSQKKCYELDISKRDSVQNSAEKIVYALKNDHSFKLAHVFKHSIHHYCLREWLGLVDYEWAKTYHLTTLPPQYMVDAISNHLIDGFCVGEPWNIQAQIQGYSCIIAESADIIPTVADKVLAVTEDWAIQHPNTHRALKMAVEKAQADLSLMTCIDQIWQLLIQYNIIQFECSDQIHVFEYYQLKNIIQSFGTQQQPQVNDFKWIIKQMIKWENLNLADDQIAITAQNCVFDMPA